MNDKKAKILEEVMSLPHSRNYQTIVLTRQQIRAWIQGKLDEYTDWMMEQVVPVKDEKEVVRKYPDGSSLVKDSDWNIHREQILENYKNLKSK